MSSETTATKTNTILGIMTSIVALLVWLTGYSNVAEMIFGKSAKEPLPANSASATIDNSLERLERMIEQLKTRNDSILSGGTSIESASTSNVDSLNIDFSSLGNLVGKHYTGPRSSVDYLYFNKFDNTRYILSGVIDYSDVKATVIESKNGKLKIESGNISGILTLEDQCKTLKGNVLINKEAKKEFTYFLSN